MACPGGQAEGRRARRHCMMCDDHRQTNGCDGPDVDEPALEDSGFLPFEVGCPAFTRELRQVRWSSVPTFKLEIPEKYDGRLNPTEFLSIYTLPC